MSRPAIDLATFQELQKAAGAEFVSELVRTFLEEAPRMIEGLAVAMTENDREKFKRLAHSLKSNSHTFGAMELGGLARNLELAGLEQVAAGDAAALARLADEYGRVAGALEELIDA